MTSKQYEELCRYFAAWLFQIPIDRVRSAAIHNSARPDLSSYAHQIDLYWEIETPAALFLLIANAKWRTPPIVVGLDEVLLLQHVKALVGAHKALMMTNTGFGEGAVAYALDEGMALHLVRPGFDYCRLHPSDPEIIQSQFQGQAKLLAGRPVCLHELILKGGQAAAQQQSAAEPSATTPLESTAIVRRVFTSRQTTARPRPRTQAAAKPCVT
jgi:hypothetical protein